MALDFGTSLKGDFAIEVFRAERLVLDVESVDIGHDVRNAGLGGGLDQLGVDVGRRTNAESDDEELLPLEGRDERLFVVVVVDLNPFDTCR